MLRGCRPNSEAVAPPLDLAALQAILMEQAHDVAVGPRLPGINAACSQARSSFLTLSAEK